jgi:glycosyltransferase involved in cell wall biosynthesis
MHVLFIHQAFPAQFGRLALELARRYGWRCEFLIERLSSCPTPSREMLDRLELSRIPLPAGYGAAAPAPWPQAFGRYLELCRGVFEGVNARRGPRPDLVVAHGGQGPPTLFLREAVDCPIVNYCEYYFAPTHCDLSYRVDLPPAETAPFYTRCINAPTLVSLLECDSGYSATQWQRQSFPARFQPRIEVHFDGIDTEQYRPGRLPRGRASELPGGRSVDHSTRIVTYVARGLESVRGFDLFMRLADRIARARSDVLFVVVGRDQTYYGWDNLHTGQPSFKQWVLDQGRYDPSRFVFLDEVEPDRLAVLLGLSDLHVYLTVPFVLSWSLLDALSCGCVVLASDVPPVREVIVPGVNGLVEPLFDTERQVEAALRVLDDPDAHRPLGRAARALMEEKYSVDVAVPGLKRYFERVASR